MGSFFSGSVLKMKDVEKMERLHYLFALAVRYPRLLPVVKVLVRLPLKPLYQLAWIIYKTYYVVFEVRWMRPYEFFLRR